MTYQTLVETIQKNGDIMIEEAQLVAEYYQSRKVGAVKFNAHDGYNVKHGAFFDKAVIRKALAEAR